METMNRLDAQPTAGEAIVFSGNAKDYFGIWIVNVLLTIVTLGIWSAWAKVRRLRYFYGHTAILGSNLDYLASPWVILKGRILVVIVLAVFSLIQNFFPLVSIVFFLVYAVLIPWVICRALRFNARNTVWRNVRFDFQGDWGQAFVAFVLFGFLSVITLGLLAPLASRMVARFVVGNHLLGRAAFQTEATKRAFYAAFGWSVLVFIGVLLVTGAIAFGLGALEAMSGGPEVAIAISMFALFPAFVVSGVFYRAMTRNLVINAMNLEGGHTFRSTIKPARLTWIVLSNVVVSLLTVGLMYPWCAVRLWRYQAENTHVRPGEDPNAFVDAQEQAGNAFGSEFSALDGIDIGI